MVRFVVTHTLDHNELADHIAKNGGLRNATVTVVADMEQATPATRNPVAAPKLATVGGTGMPRGRKPRGFTVNSAVLSAMVNGPVSTAALKEVLTQAGKKPRSLPTALAALQKSGEIERVGTGQYQLSRASLDRDLEDAVQQVRAAE